MSAVTVPGFSSYRACADTGLITRQDGSTLPASPDKDGYLRVGLKSDSGKWHTIRIHQIIALSHLGPCPARLQIDHVDGNKANNTLSNLEYVSASENSRRGWIDRVASDKQRAAAANARRGFITAADRKVIRTYKGILSRRALSLMFSCSESNISQIWEKAEKAV